jgi:hypothetical protein
LVLPLVVVVVLLARRRQWNALRLAAVVAGAMVLGAATVVRTTGPAYDYRLRWNSPLALVGMILVVWSVWELLPARRRQRWRHRATAGAIVVIVGTTSLSVVNAATAGVPYAHDSVVARALQARVDASLPGGDGVIVVRGADDGSAVHVPALVRHFEAHGEPVRVDPGGSDSYGEHRVQRPGEQVRARLVVASDDFDEQVRRPDLRLLAYWGTVSLRERARQVARRQDLQEDFGAGRITAEELVGGVQALALGTAVGVFLELPS